MAKYKISRKINDKETITVEQCHSFDEAFGILERGENELRLMHENVVKLADEKEATRIEKEMEKMEEDDEKDQEGLNKAHDLAQEATDTPTPEATA